MTMLSNADLDKYILLIPKYDPHKNSSGCSFDYEAARTAIEAIENLCTHVKGQLAGQAFILEPWQRGIIANLFGWKRADGSRRFRECLIYVPRKNGKTLLAAAILVLMLFLDNESAAEVLGAAASREQASLLFDAVKSMVRNENELNSRCKIYQKSIFIDETQSYYKVVSSEANTAHGANIHAAVVDELHSQANRELVDVIRTSTASTARRQSLVIYLSTADYSRPSICNETLKYAEQVRDNVIPDASFLPVIYCADKSDDWKSETVWKKANPNYGISIDKDYLKRECQKAQNTPAYSNTFKRLHLNLVTEQANRWVSLEHWDKCVSELPDLKGKTCYAGLDLSSTTDTTAFVLYFPESHSVLANVWIPSDGAHKKELTDRVPYLTWANQGYIDVTEGNIIDYDFIRAKINQLAKEYEIKEIAIDTWNASQLLTQLLQDELNVMNFGQSLKNLSAPTKYLEGLILSHKLNHGSNPVLRWQASNVAVYVDPNENIKMVKDKSTGRIDSMVALAMAIGRAIIQPEEKPYTCPLVII